MTDYPSLFERDLPALGSFPDCYAFSVHKSGSTLMEKMIRDACQLAGIPAINIPTLMADSGISPTEWQIDPQVASLITSGRIYFGFRFLPEVLLDEKISLRNKKAVLLVRDPRDALVSQFYSYGGKNLSHKLPKKNAEVFLQSVQRTAHMEIDEYVLHAAEQLRRKLDSYRTNLNFENVALFKYEDIYFDKHKFLSEIFDHFAISIEPSIIDTVAARHDVRPEVEDITKHIRKGAPADYLNKLRPETIAKLNQVFARPCEAFGYRLN